MLLFNGGVFLLAEFRCETMALVPVKPCPAAVGSLPLGKWPTVRLPACEGRI